MWSSQISHDNSHSFKYTHFTFRKVIIVINFVQIQSLVKCPLILTKSLSWLKYFCIIWVAKVKACIYSIKNQVWDVILPCETFCFIYSSPCTCPKITEDAWLPSRKFCFWRVENEGYDEKKSLKYCAFLLA